MHSMMIFNFSCRVVLPKNTVDKAPMSVDNLIKQVDFTSLQGCFGKKPREQKPLQSGFYPEQSGKNILQRCFKMKSGEKILLQGWCFQKHGGLCSFVGGLCSFAEGLWFFAGVHVVFAEEQFEHQNAKNGKEGWDYKSSFIYVFNWKCGVYLPM